MEQVSFVKGTNEVDDAREGTGQEPSMQQPHHHTDIKTRMSPKKVGSSQGTVCRKKGGDQVKPPSTPTTLPRGGLSRERLMKGTMKLNQTSTKFIRQEKVWQFNTKQTHELFLLQSAPNTGRCSSSFFPCRGIHPLACRSFFRYPPLP